jgi:hypothetical protein
MKEYITEHLTVEPMDFDDYGPQHIEESISENPDKDIVRHIIKEGDRIIITNIPKDYKYRHLYTGLGTVNASWSGAPISDKGNVYFLTGYTPYKDKSRFSCSGGGNNAPVDALKFVKRAPAPFWRFKNGMRRAHNDETYHEVVNYFEVDYKDLI